MPWLVAPNELTQDQQRVVDLPATENRLVSGFPGSGKTQVLLHRAATLRDRLRTPPARYRIFLFTNVLRDYVRSGLSLLELEPDSVLTFDHWCRLIWESERPGKKLPWKDKAPDFDRIRNEVLGLIKRNVGLQNLYDFVLIDEGQDLTQTHYQILRLVSKHVTVFADFLQTMFDGGTSEVMLKKELGITQRNVTLLGSYRNSQDVARVAGLFLPNDERREQYLLGSKPNSAVRERPVVLSSDSVDAELDHAAEVIRQRLVLNQTVGILVPTNRFLHGLAKAFAEKEIDVDKAIPQRSGSVEVDYDNGVPKIATFHSAKGLTFDVVLMPRLVMRSFGQFSEKDRLKMLFVGAARAREWVYFSASGRAPIPEFGMLQREAESTRLLESIQITEPGLFDEKTEPSFDDTDDEASLF